MFLYNRLREGYLPVPSGMSMVLVPVHPEAGAEKEVAQFICSVHCSLLFVFLLNYMIFNLLSEYQTYRHGDSASSL